MRLRSATAGIRETCVKRRRANGAPRGYSLFPTRQSHQGFTLLEVLAAILLLGIAFAVMMQLAGGAIGLTGQAADASEAAMWARSKLDSAYVVEPLQPGRSDGRFDRKFRWQLNVSPWNGDVADRSTPLQMYQLDLQVSWGPATHPHTADFRTLRLLSSPTVPGP